MGKQHTAEMREFINKKAKYNIATKHDNLFEVREIAYWCRDNFTGDGAGRFESQDVSVRWYMIDKSDYIAFKLRWI